MIKAKVIKPFYYAKDKELYLEEDRFKELSDQGYVVEVERTKKKVIKVEMAVPSNPCDIVKELKKHDTARFLSD